MFANQLKYSITSSLTLWALCISTLCLAGPAQINLAELDGRNGFALRGTGVRTSVGLVVGGGGDYNADHISDLLIGAPFHLNNGQGYLVYGQNGAFPAQITLSDLNGTQGVTLSVPSTQHSFTHNMAHAGDLNGDGIDDFVVNDFNPTQDNEFIGNTYVVFGRQGGFSTDIAVGDLDGSNGFVIPNQTQNNLVYRVTSAAGDLNGDGLDDLAVGSPTARLNGTAVGIVYIIYGRQQAFPASLDLNELDGGNGFALIGAVPDGLNGQSVGRAGDLNGDGIDDLIIGDGADPIIIDAGKPSTPVENRGATSANLSYVVFGNPAGFPAQFDLANLNGSNGFAMSHAGFDPFVTRTVDAAGDINHDGFDDAIVCRAAGAVAEEFYGECYLVLGHTGNYPALLDLASLNGSNGFTIRNDAPFGEFGNIMSPAGDFNGDGLDDIIIGSPYTFSPPLSDPGVAYIVYGQCTGFPALVELNALDNTSGLQINGPYSRAYVGYTVSRAGDVNKDGVDDVIIGSFPFTIGANEEPGASYVVFGNSQIFKDGFES